MKILLLLPLILLLSCGQETEIQREYHLGYVQYLQPFEGLYYLENGGQIELIANHENKITINSSYQYVLSVNPYNDTIGEHPRITGNNLLIKDNEIRFTANVNYTDGNDIEEDYTGNDIRDIHKTDYLIKFKNGKLMIQINIWENKIGNNINNIIATRNIYEI